MIDGLDGSGKATQTELLLKWLLKQEKATKKISFPNYDDPSSVLVKMYLNGDFGNKPSDVNAFAASSFYAVDRYASYKRYWKQDYEKGTIILCDRYVSSNAIHQMVKLPQSQWDQFLDWLYDYEYQKLSLPKPNIVLYLDMHPSVSRKLLSTRYHGEENRKDLHERDFQYLLSCREAALYAAKRQGWIVIPSSDEKAAFDVALIHQKILTEIKEMIE